MKTLLFVCLTILPFPIYSQSTPNCINRFFGRFEGEGLVFETELNKFEYNYSEPILLTTYVRNNSKADTSLSVSLHILADRGGYNFTLINMNSGSVARINSHELGGFEIDLSFSNGTIAPGERIKAFTIDLNQFTQNKPLIPMSNFNGLTRIYSPGEEPIPRYVGLGLGLYQVIWSINTYGQTISKPIFFQLK